MVASYLAEIDGKKCSVTIVFYSRYAQERGALLALNFLQAVISILSRTAYAVEGGRVPTYPKPATRKAVP